MKKILFFFAAVFLFYSGCNNSDGGSGNNPVVPDGGEVRVATISYDSNYNIFGGSSFVISKPFNFLKLNFTDRANMRISFSYKASSLNEPNIFELFYTDTVRGQISVYKLTDSSPLPEFKTINLTVPSPRVNAFFSYTVKASSNNSEKPYVVLKDLNAYKN